MKKTIRIALYAGPGTGKSMLAARLYSELMISKPFGEVALCQEFAKLLVYMNKINELEDQIFVTNGQADMMRPYIGNVDVVVTDSPIELGLIYGKPDTKEEVSSIIKEETNNLRTINFFIERIPDIEYQTEGRMQTQAGAREKDEEILDFLKENGMPYIRIKNEYDIAAVICHMTEEIGLKRNLLFSQEQKDSQSIDAQKLAYNIN